MLNPNGKSRLEEVCWLVAVANEMLHYLARREQIVMANSAQIVCPDCGSAMICLGYTPSPLIVACSLPVHSSRAQPHSHNSGRGHLQTALPRRTSRAMIPGK